MKNNQRIIFYGALGKKGEQVIGGGETGNLRTIQLLEKNGLKIIKVYKPYPVKNLAGYLVYTFKMFIKLFEFFFVLLENQSVKTVHISGFYLHLIYHELLLILITKISRKKCIYELRGGGVIDAFQNRSFIYRIFFKSALNHASVILCQGKSYIDFIKTLTEKEVKHYPNYILNQFLINKTNNIQRNYEIPQLVYFGRIVESKNIELLLEICNELKKMNFRYRMEIIGKGDLDFFKILQAKSNQLGLNNSIKFSEPLNSTKLKETLLTKHFFLFPTKEKREGHSNSLTEAMALGVVPVCSPAGFNSEIIGNKELIINDYDAKEYATKIISIWTSGRWKELSNAATSMILYNYTENVAEKIITEVYLLKN